MNNNIPCNEANLPPLQGDRLRTFLDQIFPAEPIKPVCTGCNKTPAEIAEYVEAATPENYGGEGCTPDEFVKREEGTYNRLNGHFLCTACYVRAGCPTGSPRWVAP